MNIEIANRLYEFRKAYGFSQEELAEKIGVSRQAISKWERSESSPDTDNLIALAKLYNISIDDLINGEDKPAKEEPAPEQTEQPKDNVNISMRGIDVQSKDGDQVHIGLDGIQVNQNGTQPDGHIFNGNDKKKKPWISALIWIGGIILFLLIGAVAPKGWSIGWIIFLLMPAIDSGIDAVIANKPQKFIYPLMVVALFCALGMSFHIWHPAWILFLTIPIYYIFSDNYNKSDESKNGRTPLFIIVAIICALVMSSTLGIVVNTAFSGKIKPVSVNNIIHFSDDSDYSVGSSSVSANDVNGISVDWASGNIDVIATDSDTITFTETEQTDEDMKLRYKVEDGILKIEFCKAHITTDALTKKDLKITVPDRLFSSLDIDSANSDINVSKTSFSEFSVDSASGDITAEGSFGVVDIDSVSGAVMIKSYTAPTSLDFDSVSGNCDIYLPADISGFKVDYDSVAGNVSTEGFGTVTNTNGGITYGNASTQIGFDSVSANVTIHAINE